MGKLFVDADGASYDIPDEEAAGAAADGLRPAVEFADDSGSKYAIPEDEAPTAFADGLKPLGGWTPPAAPAPVAAAPAPVAPVEEPTTPADEPGFLSRAGSFLWDNSPPRAAYEFAREAITGEAPESSLGKSVKAYHEGGIKGAMLGVSTPLNYVKAATDYVRDAVDPDVEADFDRALAAAKADTTSTQQAAPIAATAGEVAGAVGSSLATGGVSGLAAKAAPQAARALVTYAGRGVAQRASVAAGVLLAEGAAQGALLSAAQELDKAADRGDFKGVGERMFSAAPGAIYEGATSNLLYGGAMKLGVLGVSKTIGAFQRYARGGLPEVMQTKDAATAAYTGVARQAGDRVEAIGEELDALEAKLGTVTDDTEAAALRDRISALGTEQSQLAQVVREAQAEAAAGGDLAQLAVKTVNKAAPPPAGTVEAMLHDPVRPLRASDLDDAGGPIARAARANVDAETVAAVRLTALDAIEQKGQRLLELEAKMDHELRLATKSAWVKEFQAPWRGPSFDEMLSQAGLTDDMLADLEKRTQGEGASQVARLRDKIELIRSELPQAPQPRAAVLAAPKPGQRVTTMQPALVDNPYQNVAELGALRKSLEKAAKGSPTPPAQTMTLGHMAAALDQVKRDAQRLAARKSGLIHDRLLKPTEALRLALEDRTTFAEFAERQAPVNSVWSYDIDTSRSQFLNGFFRDGNVKADRVGGDPYEVVEVLDRARIASHLESVGMPRGTEDQIEEALKRRLRARELSYTERLPWTANDAGLAKDLHEYTKLRKEVEDEVNRVALANRALAAKKADPGLLEKAAATGATGTLAKHLKDRAAAWVTDRAQDTSGAAFGLKAQAARVQQRLTEAAKKTDARKIVDGERIQRAVRVAPTTQTVKKALEDAERAQDPESEDYGKLQSSLQRVEELAGPELAAAYAEQFAARNEFLLEKAGPAPAPSAFNGKPKRVLDDETAETLGRYKDAADDPVAALERIGAGDGTSEDHETLERLYPGMLSDFKSKVVAKLAESESELDYEAQLAVSQALRLPLTPEQQPDAQAFWQNYSKSQAQAGAEEAMRKRAPRLGGGDMKSKGDRIS